MIDHTAEPTAVAPARESEYVASVAEMANRVHRQEAVRDSANPDMLHLPEAGADSPSSNQSSLKSERPVGSQAYANIEIGWLELLGTVPGSIGCTASA